MAILINDDGEILLTKRSRHKIAAGKWECTAGSVLAGETSRDAIVREVKEEIGISPIFAEEPVSEYLEDNAIFDIWVGKVNHQIADLLLQEEEVDEAMYATLDDVKKIIEEDQGTKSLGEVVRLDNRGLIQLKKHASAGQ